MFPITKCKHKIAGKFNINCIDSIFYALNVEQKKINLFDSNGDFLEEKEFHEKLILILEDSMPSGSMCKYKDQQLYMTDFSGT